MDTNGQNGNTAVLDAVELDVVDSPAGKVLGKLGEMGTGVVAYRSSRPGKVWLEVSTDLDAGWESKGGKMWLTASTGGLIRVPGGNARDGIKIGLNAGR